MTDWGESVDVDVNLQQADPNQYDALHLPGGAMNPDKLRQIRAAVEFAKSFMTAGKPVSAICHAAWTLIEPGSVRDRTMSSWPSLNRPHQRRRALDRPGGRCGWQSHHQPQAR